MRRSVLLLVLVAACGDDDDGGSNDAGGSDATPPTGMATFEVEHYDVHVDVTTRQTEVKATLAITGEGNCVAIDYAPAAVGTVMLGGQDATDVALADGKLSACGAGWSAGASVELAVTLEHAIEVWAPSQVGLSTWNDAQGVPFFYFLSWVGECDRHGPCDARPDRFPTYRFVVDHPSGTKVLCPGTVTAGETQTTCQFDHAGGPTYSTFAFMASPSWTVVELGSWNGVTATLYDMPDSPLATDFDVDAAAGFLDWMAARFGPYPYGTELRFVAGPTYWAGFEHPGNISLGEWLGQTSIDAQRHTVLHEMAHQWAGDQTTLADVYDFVWKESTVEYLSYVYEDEEVDAAVGAATAAGWKQAAPASLYFLVPDERPPLLDYYGDVYDPGPMVLFRQLEVMYGRPAILSALAMVLGQERSLSVEELRMALEAATGADLTAYFDAWVYGSAAPQWPRATVTLTPGVGTTEVAVSLATTDGVARGCQFTLKVLGPAVEQDLVFDFGVDGAAQPSQMVDFVATGHVLDPYTECLVYPATMPKAPPRRAHPWTREAFLGR